MKQVLCCIALLLAGLSLTTSAQSHRVRLPAPYAIPKDAVIAGAKLKVTQSCHRRSRAKPLRMIAANFSAPNCRPGEYSVTVTGHRFQGRTFTGIILAVIKP
jgi:hypothetical protein